MIFSGYEDGDWKLKQFNRENTGLYGSAESSAVWVYGDRTGRETHISNFVQVKSMFSLMMPNCNQTE